MLSAPTIATFLVMASFAASTGAFFMLPFKRRHLSSTTIMAVSASKKGKLLVLGGTGFLGQTVCKRAVLEGYEVTSLSRRGLPPASTKSSTTKIDYRKGDAREKEAVTNILSEGGFSGIVHCIGLLLDSESGLGEYNVLVSGSGSILDSTSTYDTITRITAFNAIDAAIEYSEQTGLEKPFPFCFTSAAEAGWPDVLGGPQIEKFLAPEWLRRYLVAKRAVEQKLLGSSPLLRPVIVRPSLIYSLDRPSSYVPVGAFFVGNTVGLPFVDRPVTVQALSCAIVRSMDNENIQGIQRYQQIDELSQ